MKPVKKLWNELGKEQKEVWKRIYKETLQEIKDGYEPEVIAHNVALLAAWDIKMESKHGFLQINK